MGNESSCSCRKPCTDVNSNLDMSREANPIYDQFYGQLKLNLNIAKYDRSEDGNFEVLDFAKHERGESNNVRMMIENKHAPSSVTAKYLMKVPDYRNVIVEEAIARFGRLWDNCRQAEDCRD